MHHYKCEGEEGGSPKTGKGRRKKDFQGWKKILAPLLVVKKITYL